MAHLDLVKISIQGLLKWLYHVKPAFQRHVFTCFYYFNSTSGKTAGKVLHHGRDASASPKCVSSGRIPWRIRCHFWATVTIPFVQKNRLSY